MPEMDPLAQQIEAWQREQWLELTRQIACEAGLDPEALIAPPVREADDCHRYCPRCRRQYTALAETCSSCGELRLASFAAVESATVPRVEATELPAETAGNPLPPDELRTSSDF